MNLDDYRQSVNQHGLGATLYRAAYRAANHVTEVAVWNALVLDEDHVDKSFLPSGDRPPGRMVEAAAMRSYVEDPANVLTHRFIDEAMARGDRCYAICDEDDALLSYGWYSTRPTRLSEIADEPTLYFDPKYAYMYHGYTRPEHRGRRLHAIGMAAALVECRRTGLHGLVTYVVSSNFSSLKSCYRMGYQTFGHLIMLKVGARHVWHASPGCKKYGFRVEETAS
jgi:hypothetical protein